jgi:archaetidylinositol phosphate synthase
MTIASKQAYLANWSHLHGGYQPRRGGLVFGYLSLMYAVAAPMARLRISPDAVTLGALAFTGAAPLLVMAEPGPVRLLAAAVLIGTTGLLDGVDGAVAVLQRRTSSWGAVLDSLADRCTELLYLVTLLLVGAPLQVVLIAGVVTLLQEYVRARAGMVGLTEITTVTVSERPTRIALTAMTCLGLASLSVLNIDVPLALITAWIWAALAMISFAQITMAVRQRLKSADGNR